MIPGSPLSAAGLGRAVSGQHPLPELDVPGPEGPGAGQEIKIPHAFERLVVLVLQFRPRLLEVPVPSHQRPAVVRPHVVQVLRNEETLDGPADLGDAGQHAVGEDVLVYPRIALDPRFVGAYRVEEEDGRRP